MDPKNSLINIILSNMIENALIFTDQKHAEISLKITDNGTELNIQLEDKGIGIEDTFHDRIFDMYFRSSELSKGNGLGLYVVKTALGKLHGDISVMSEKNKYTLFEINIPY
jgi:sensor histidine kinase regulating citrate/malate metabolism